MNKAKHTPGPWIAGRAHSGMKAVILANDTVGHAFNLATLNMQYDERDADAALIAAAPDLLAALDRLTRAAANRERTMGDPLCLLDCQAELGAALMEAHAAIDKATGKLN